MGYGDGDEATVLGYGGDANNKHITTYLRHKFTVDDASIYDSLVFNLLRDDGAVVYLNGTEVFRSNMPTGTITNSTLASSAVGGANENTFFEFKAAATLLQNGMNVIAVELHQANATSSDLSFDMSVGFELPPLPPTTFPVKKFTHWHYLDNGADLDATNWTDTLFDDDKLGLGTRTFRLWRPYEYDHKLWSRMPIISMFTYYFRRDVMIDMVSLPDSLQIGLRRDDGAIVYINGNEIFRDNLPATGVTYTTTAINTISGSAEQSYITYNFHKSAFVNGRNTIAVRIHNRDVFSSDLGFDLYIAEAPVPNPQGLGCANDTNHIACFISIPPTSQTPNLIIPSSHRFQMLFQQGDAYTKGGGTAGGNHDFTGYIPLNGDSRLGHVFRKPRNFTRRCFNLRCSLY